MVNSPLKLYDGVEATHSFQDTAGQVFDCIRADSQPAVLRSGKPLATPPPAPGADVRPGKGLQVLHAARQDGHGNAMACPEGFVAVRRVTLDELTRFESMAHFLRKGPRHADRKKPEAPPDTPSAANATHNYAHASQAVSNLGGRSLFSVWSPEVGPRSVFSLSQHWYVAASERGVQTAEVGWQVYPQKYGHAKPVLFSYWTADGYHSTGSYSNDGHDFVQVSATCPLGFALDHVSVVGGAQAELDIAYFLSGGNWWLYVGGTAPENAIGYYPASQYAPGPMTSGALKVDFGGETCTNAVFPPMGSGAFAAGGYRQSAYHRNIQYFDANGAVQTADLVASEQWPDSYTIELQNAGDWGEYFYYGGPGRPA